MNDKNKPTKNMDIFELREEWNKTFFSKRICVAAPVALVVGIPIAAVTAPVAGAVAGMAAGLAAANRVFRKKNKTETNSEKK